MTPEVIASTTQDVVGTCGDTAALLGEACLTVSQAAEELAASPMQRNLAGIAMLQRNAAVEVENAARFGKSQASRVTVDSLSTVIDAGRMILDGHTRPSAVVSNQK